MGTVRALATVQAVKNGPNDDRYNVVGEHESEFVCPESGQRRSSTYTVRIKLHIGGEIIKDARYEVFGDLVTMAAAAWCVQEAVGLTVDDAEHLFTAAKIAAALGVSWGEDNARGCLTVSIAVLTALDNYRKQPPGGPPA